jgi:hypothetical protein
LQANPDQQKRSGTHVKRKKKKASEGERKGYLRETRVFGEEIIMY